MKTKFATLVLCLAASFTNFIVVAQEEFIAPSDNFVADGIPKIPVQLAEAVGRYTEIRAAGLASWHPIKREMLILTRFGDTLQAHLVQMPGGARRQLTFFKEGLPASATSLPRETISFSPGIPGVMRTIKSTVTISPLATSRC